MMLQVNRLVVSFTACWAVLPQLTAQAQTEVAARPDSLVEGIIYTSLGPPNWDIYLFDGPDAEPRRLTDDPARDYNAVFSPDGRWVVFTSERAGNADLYALDLETGGEAVPLTRDEAMDDAASFSPDGGQLAFVSTREGDADVFVMPFAPGDPGAGQRAVNLTRRPGGDFNPAVSPDGRSIAYSRQDDLGSIGDLETGVLGSAATDVYVMDADGSNPRRLSDPGAISGSPAWSADGAVYYYRLAIGAVEVRRIAADGTGDAGIGAYGLTPAVMPGGRVAFSQPQPRPGMDAVDVLRTGRIFSVEPDGSGRRPESDTTRSWFAPAFDRGSARMLAHGSGPVEGITVIGDGLFALPDARRRVTLPDRTIEVRGIRGYFPAITPAGDVLSVTPPRSVRQCRSGSLRLTVGGCARCSRRTPGWRGVPPSPAMRTWSSSPSDRRSPMAARASTSGSSVSTAPMPSISLAISTATTHCHTPRRTAAASCSAVAATGPAGSSSWMRTAGTGVA
jgi:hypothetical protein